MGVVGCLCVVVCVGGWVSVIWCVCVFCLCEWVVVFECLCVFILVRLCIRIHKRQKEKRRETK